MRRFALLLSIALCPLGCKEESRAPAPAVTPTPAATPPVATPPAAAPAPAGNPNDPAQAVAQMQKALGGVMGNNPNVKTVGWRDLAPLLGDELAGWKADGEVKGESTAMGGFQVSEVRRDYKKDASRATVKITDTSMNTMLSAAFSMGRMANVDASDHYQRGVDVAGQPGIEEWHQSNKNAKVTVLVGGRFIVETSTSGVPDAKPLIELIGKLDLAKLATLK